jgi:hypothetical protein
MVRCLPQQMGPHGLQGHLGLQIVLKESPMEIAPLWQWVVQESPLPLQMGLHGHQGLWSQHYLCLMSQINNYNNSNLNLFLTGTPVRGLLTSSWLSTTQVGLCSEVQVHSTCPLIKTLPQLT